jgi:hypothetical protein
VANEKETLLWSIAFPGFGQLLNETTLLFYFRGAYPLSKIAPHCERLKIEFAFFMKAPAYVQIFVDHKHFVKTDSAHLHCTDANDA